MIYFTADTHFYHYNIVDLCGRDIGKAGWMNRDDVVARMNEVLIARWNNYVRPEDTIYHLGDFAFCGKTRAQEVLEQLNGKKIWILGNHDYSLADKVGVYFDEIYDYRVIRVHEKYQDDDGEWRQFHRKIVLCHFPIESWDGMGHGSWHLHGHCHGNLRNQRGLRMDVGVDTNNLAPYSLDEITKVLTMRSVVLSNDYQTPDHH